MKYRNKTPHVITLRHDDGFRLLEPERPAARVRTRAGPVSGTYRGVAIHEPGKLVSVVNLPAEEPDTLVIVSQITAIVAARLQPARKDIVYPATGRHEGAERDERGVLSVQRLIRAA